LTVEIPLQKPNDSPLPEVGNNTENSSVTEQTVKEPTVETGQKPQEESMINNTEEGELPTEVIVDISSNSTAESSKVPERSIEPVMDVPLSPPPSEHHMTIEEQRANIIKEIIDTETTYYQSMNSLLIVRSSILFLLTFYTVL
jgi:hypothetical protein